MNLVALIRKRKSGLKKAGNRRLYYKLRVKAVRKKLAALAHITGGSRPARIGAAEKKRQGAYRKRKHWGKSKATHVEPTEPWPRK